MSQPITVEAVFEDGVFRPAHPLLLPPHQRVTLTVEVSKQATPWPADAATIYSEIAAEDLRLAEAASTTVVETWPRNEEQP